MGNRYKVVLIGCGSIATKHIEAITEQKDLFELVGICDTNKESRERLVERFNLSSLGQYYDYDSMINQEAADIAAIAAPTFLHHEMAKRCISAGLSVVIEKPISLSTTHAIEIGHLAKQRGVKVQVGYITRFAPHFQTLKRVIDDGGFGEILEISLNVNWNRGSNYYLSVPWRGTWEKDGGTLMNQGTHGIDLLLWLMNSEITEVYGITKTQSKPIETEDYASAIVQFENGAVANVKVTVNVFQKNLSSTLTILGTDGTVVVGGTHMNMVEVWDFADEKYSILRPHDAVWHGHKLMYEDLYDSLEEERDTLNNAKEASKSLDLVLGIHASSKRGGPVVWPVSFSLSEMIAKE